MAFCGSFLDETKDDEKNDWSDEDLDPDNTMDFPTNTKLCSCQEENLIVKDKNGSLIDRRVKVRFKKTKFHCKSYFMLCNLIAKLKGGKCAVGTGSFSFSKQHIFLTCAHNLMMVSTTKNKFVQHECVKVYMARQGKNSYILGGKVNNKQLFTHPKFNGDPACGFDIGIAAIWKIKEGKHDNKTHGSNQTVRNDVIRHYANPSDLKKGMTVEIAGYPAEKGGEPHTHKGKIIEITKTALGGHLIWYDADTTDGNSGSSIYILDEKLAKSASKDAAVQKILIGVHSGHDRVMNMNYGTLITETLHDWIEMKVKN